MTDTVSINTTNEFGLDYFLNGKESGLSNFENYRWLPDSTISWAKHFMRYMGLREGDSTFEIGCARGYYCRALRMLGVQAFGYDISEWAIANCDPEVRAFVSNHLNVNGASYDVTWMKDCAEHILPRDLKALIQKILPVTRRKMFLIVPLAEKDGGAYVHPKEENDSTHVNRWTLETWIVFLQRCSSSFVASGAFCYPGLKPGAYEVDRGYGFLVLERI